MRYSLAPTLFCVNIIIVFAEFNILRLVLDWSVKLSGLAQVKHNVQIDARLADFVEPTSCSLCSACLLLLHWSMCLTKLHSQLVYADSSHQLCDSLKEMVSKLSLQQLLYSYSY